MNLPTSNNPAETLASLNAHMSQTRSQIAAMEALRETGDRLFASICRGDMDSLGDILEARSAACVRLNQLAVAADPIHGSLDTSANSEYPQIREAAAELLRLNEQMDSLRTQILTNQQECEEALRAALADTGRQLREAAGEKKVRFAYQAATATSPQYLDSRK